MEREEIQSRETALAFYCGMQGKGGGPGCLF